MANRCNFYFRQAVTEAELDLAFEQLEDAVNRVATDVGMYGIISGAQMQAQSPATMNVELTSPARAYDNLGQRIYFGSDQVVDCTVDYNAIPTQVQNAGNERWLGVFIKFARQLSDLRVDGNSQQVYFRHDESFEIVVRQGAEAAIGAAQRVELVDDELLLGDIKLVYGQSAIASGDIDLTRKQDFVFIGGTAISVNSTGWVVLNPDNNQIQSTLDVIDQVFSDHFNGSSNRHDANQIDYTPHGFIDSNNVGDALDELVDDLAATSPQAGATRIGAEGIAGTPYNVGPGNVASQASQLLSNLNDHTSSGDHDNRYYNTGETVLNADTVDFRHANEFAESGHDHDSRYYRLVFADTVIVDSGQFRPLVVLPGRYGIVQICYENLDQDDKAVPPFYHHGQLSDSIRVFALASGNQFEFRVENNSGEKLQITVLIMQT